MATPSKMEKGSSLMVERILQLTLEIIYLLTGEHFSSVYGDHVTLKIPPPHSLIPECNTQQKILEVTNKIIYLLTGEFPIKCGDVAVYFSVEERDYLEGHKELYKDAMMEGQQLPLLQDTNRSTPERSPQAFNSQDPTQEEDNITHHDQNEDLVMMKVEVKEEAEETGVRGEEQIARKKISPEISTDTRLINVKTEEEEVYVKKKKEIPLQISTDPGDAIVEIEERLLEVKEEIVPVEIGTDGRYNCTNTNNHVAFSPEDEAEDDDDPTGDRNNLLDNSLVGNEFHAGEKPYSCSKCGKCFSQKSNLNRHERVHTGEKPFSCSKCGKCFPWRSDLLTHEKIHTGEKPYSCSECGKCFARKSFLVTHEKIHTGEKPFSCSQCGKCFSLKAVLIAHVRVHTGEKPFSCSECGKCFSVKSHLTRHETVHTGERPYSCSECGKCFSQQSSLASHKRAHKGQMPYSCSQCGKGFSCKTSLTTHERVHTGEKPYSCSDCGKHFSRDSNLIRHIRIHTGEKPFSCSECGKCFTEKSDLIRHERVHIGERLQTHFFQGL